MESLDTHLFLVELCCFHVQCLEEHSESAQEQRIVPYKSHQQIVFLFASHTTLMNSVMSRYLDIITKKEGKKDLAQLHKYQMYSCSQNPFITTSILFWGDLMQLTRS